MVCRREGGTSKGRRVIPHAAASAVFCSELGLESVFDLLKDIALVLLGLDLGELFEQFLLPLGQVARRDQLDDDMLIAARCAMHDGHAHALQAEAAAALRSGWNLDCCLAFQCAHGHFRAQRCLAETQRQLVDDVVALPLEERMRLHGQADIEVARCAATRADFALASDADIDAIIDARRDIDCHAAVVAHAPLTPTGGAGRRNHLALAPAAVTDHHVDKLPEDRLLHSANLARALAGRAALGLCARLRACAVAGATVFPAGNFNLLLAAKNSLFKGDRQFIANVSAALAAGPARLGRGATKKLLKDICEAGAKAIAAKVAIRACAHASMAEAVIDLAFLRVAENHIRLVDLLEARLSAFLLVPVGVKLKRQLPKRFLDFVFAGALCHTEYFVIVAFDGHWQPLVSGGAPGMSMPGTPPAGITFRHFCAAMGVLPVSLPLLAARPAQTIPHLRAK